MNDYKIIHEIEGIKYVCYASGERVVDVYDEFKVINPKSQIIDIIKL